MTDQQIKENLAAITNPAPPKRSILSPPQSVGPLTQVFSDLYESGYRQVRVSYSGYGDSGSVDVALAYEGAGGELPGTGQRLPEAQSNVIVDWVESFLPGGWEINEGSTGEAIIDLRWLDGNTCHPAYVSGVLTIEHGTHEIATEYETIEGLSICTR